MPESNDAQMAFDPEFAAAAEYALYYHSIGLQAVPAMSPTPGEQWKRPSIKWKDLEHALMSREAALALFGQEGTHRKTKNIGILTGKASSRAIDGKLYKLCVLDMDTYKSDACKAWWDALMQLHNNGMELETVEQITGGGGRQLLFWAPHEWEARTCKFPHLNLDIRGDGGFVVFAPSMHESGRAYVIVDGREPWDGFQIEIMPQWLMDEITRLTAAYGGGGASSAPAQRTETPATSRTLSGRLKDGREQKMVEMVWAALVDLREASPIKGDFTEERDETFERYLGVVATRIRGESNEAGLEREGRGRTAWNEKWAHALEKWDTTLAEAVGVRREQKPPPFVQEWIDPDTGEVIQIDPETGEVLADGADKTPDAPPAGSDDPPAPKRPVSNTWDPWRNYTVPDFPLHTLPPKVRLYVQTLSTSTGGDINAAVMCALTVAASAIDGRYRLKMKRTGGWEVPCRLWAMMVGDPSSKKSPLMQECARPLIAIEREADKAYARELAAWKREGKENGDPEPNKPLRYIFNSITVEKVADILSRQDRGALLMQDELGGWISNIDGPKGRSSEAEKAFWAQAYNGNRFKVDRIQRGELTVENLLTSILGGVQPNTIKKMGDLADNGLLQRFIIVMMRQGELSQEVDDDLSRGYWDTLIKRLSSLKPVTMIASDEALRVFADFQRRMNGLQRTTGLGAQFCTMVGKLDGLQGTLAMLLALMRGLWGQPVDAEAATAAAEIIETFVIPHALAFYQTNADKSDWEGLQSIASYVLACDLDRITGRDFTRNVRLVRGLGSWELAQKVSPLVAAGWLEEEFSKGGGVVKAWNMVPGVREALAERRAEQIAERRASFEVLKRLRGVVEPDPAEEPQADEEDDDDF